MSSFKEYALEKEKIDYYKTNGYVIRKVTESLDGALVEYVHTDNKKDKQELVLSTADGRKYLSSLVFELQTQQIASGE